MLLLAADLVDAVQKICFVGYMILSSWHMPSSIKHSSHSDPSGTAGSITVLKPLGRDNASSAPPGTSNGICLLEYLARKDNLGIVRACEILRDNVGIDRAWDVSEIGSVWFMSACVCSIQGLAA